MEHDDAVGTALIGNAPTIIWVINNFIAYKSTTYIRDLTVSSIATGSHRQIFQWGVRFSIWRSGTCRFHLWGHWVNTLRQRQNGRHLPDDIFKCIFLNENVWISHKISLKFVPRVPINNIPALVLIMAWHRPGDKPLSEPMMVSLLTHICVIPPQWVKIESCMPVFSLGNTVIRPYKNEIKIYSDVSPLSLQCSM